MARHTLSNGGATTQIYERVVDGSYGITLHPDETVGYDVVVSCVGAGSTSTLDGKTTFVVDREHVTCTFTLTGESTHFWFFFACQSKFDST
jgi:hypothetical protein